MRLTRLALPLCGLLLAVSEVPSAFAAPQPVVITNGPAKAVPVTVENAPVPPEDVQVFTSVSIPDGSTSITKTLYTVPAGKRLVIDFVAANGPKGNTAAISISTELKARPARFPLPITDLGAPANATAMMVKILADAETEVKATIGMERLSSGGFAGTVTFTGHLVDAP